MNRRAFIVGLIAVPIVSGISYLFYRKRPFEIRNESAEVLTYLKKHKDALPLARLKPFLDYPRRVNLDEEVNSGKQVEVLKVFVNRFSTEEIPQGNASLSSTLQDWIESDFEKDRALFLNSWLIADTQLALLILDVHKNAL